MSFSIRVANFQGRGSEKVAWVHIATGNCPGAKRGPDGTGLNPKLILAILGDDPTSDTPHQAHLREVSLKAVALTQPAPASPVAKKAVAQATSDMFYVWDGEQVLDSVMTRAEAIHHARNPLALFSVPSDAENWQPAEHFGLSMATDNSAPPTAPLAIAKPEVASGRLDAPEAFKSESESILAQINAARGKRILSGKTS